MFRDVDTPALLDLLAEELANILAAAGDVVSDGGPSEALSGGDAEEGGEPCAAADEAPTDALADAKPARRARPSPARAASGCSASTWLACGDSADPTIIAHVMGADRVALLFSSPPYGNQRDYTTGVSDCDALIRGVFGAAAGALREDHPAAIAATTRSRKPTDNALGMPIVLRAEARLHHLHAARGRHKEFSLI